MHRFRSNGSLIRLRLGSFFLVVLMLSLVLLMPAVVYGTVFGGDDGLLIAAFLLVSAALSGILYLMVGSGVRCPLCHGPVLGRRSCVHSQKARKMFGSYRLGVASRVLLVGHFRCPYCGEACKCQLATSH